MCTYRVQIRQPQIQNQLHKNYRWKMPANHRWSHITFSHLSISISQTHSIKMKCKKYVHNRYKSTFLTILENTHSFVHSAFFSDHVTWYKFLHFLAKRTSVCRYSAALKMLMDQLFTKILWTNQDSIKSHACDQIINKPKWIASITPLIFFSINCALYLKLSKFYSAPGLRMWTSIIINNNVSCTSIQHHFFQIPCIRCQNFYLEIDQYIWLTRVNVHFLPKNPNHTNGEYNEHFRKVSTAIILIENFALKWVKVKNVGNFSLDMENQNFIHSGRVLQIFAILI